MLDQLSVSAEITAESRAFGYKVMADLAEMVDLSLAKGPIHRAPLGFVLAIKNSVVGPREDLEALWRMVE